MTGRGKTLRYENRCLGKVSGFRAQIPYWLFRGPVMSPFPFSVSVTSKLSVVVLIKVCVLRSYRLQTFGW